MGAWEWPGCEGIGNSGSATKLRLDLPGNFRAALSSPTATGARAWCYGRSAGAGSDAWIEFDPERSQQHGNETVERHERYELKGLLGGEHF